MAELPKDEKSREAVRPLFLSLSRNLASVNRKRRKHMDDLAKLAIEAQGGLDRGAG
jgi:hypothetical protein